MPVTAADRTARANPGWTLPPFRLQRATHQCVRGLRHLQTARAAFSRNAFNASAGLSSRNPHSLTARDSIFRSAASAVAAAAPRTNHCARNPLGTRQIPDAGPAECRNDPRADQPFGLNGRGRLIVQLHMFGDVALGKLGNRELTAPAGNIASGVATVHYIPRASCARHRERGLRSACHFADRVTRRTERAPAQQPSIAPHKDFAPDGRTRSPKPISSPSQM